MLQTNMILENCTHIVKQLSESFPYLRQVIYIYKYQVVKIIATLTYFMTF